MEARGVAERYRDNEYARDWWESHTILPRTALPRTADYVLPWETEFVPKLDAQGRPWFR